MAGYEALELVWGAGAAKSIHQILEDADARSLGGAALLAERAQLGTNAYTIALIT